jgi:23S rRNA (guanosine2251-2'-O)-methyltransferase
VKKIIGRKPVLEAIRAGETIECIYIQQGQKGSAIDEIYKLSKSKSLKLKEVPAVKFAFLANDKNTQGVVAFGSEQKYYELDELVDQAKKSTAPLLLVLDNIQDPHNLGAIIRSAECAGVDGIIITKYKSSTLTDTVEKTSAGAVEYVKLCKVNNLDQTLKYLKEQGFWLFGSYLDGAVEYTTADYNMPAAIVVGNEEKGIRSLTAKDCDFLVKIPMKGNIQSLNVSVATGVLLFEVLHQRSLKK